MDIVKQPDQIRKFTRRAWIRTIVALGLLAADNGLADTGLANTGLANTGLANTGREPRTVLFICQFGSVKSAMARELLRQKAIARGLKLKVISRAITPEAHAAPALLTKLAGEGINLSADPLRQLDAPTLQSADVVIVFDDLPANLSRQGARDWRQMPSMNNDYLNARPYLDAHLDQLLAELETSAR